MGSGISGKNGKNGTYEEYGYLSMTYYKGIGAPSAISSGEGAGRGKRRR